MKTNYFPNCWIRPSNALLDLFDWTPTVILLLEINPEFNVLPRKFWVEPTLDLDPFPCSRSVVCMDKTTGTGNEQDEEIDGVACALSSFPSPYSERLPRQLRTLGHTGWLTGCEACYYLLALGWEWELSRKRDVLSLDEEGRPWSYAPRDIHTV